MLKIVGENNFHILNFQLQIAFLNPPILVLGSKLCTNKQISHST